MEKVEKLLEPGNPFDQGSRINQDYFKLMRDVIVDLDSRVKALEARISPSNKELKSISEELTGPQQSDGNTGYVEKPKKSKKNAG